MGRRGKNEGTIYQRSDGRWCARIYQSDGRPKYLYAATRMGASKKLNAAMRARDDGVSLPGDRKKVEAFMQDWLAGMATTVRPGTWKRYRDLVRLHVSPALGGLTLTRVQPEHIQRLYADKLASGLSPTTVHHIHACLHKAFDQAVRWRLMVRNPCDLVDAPRMARHEMKVLSPEQARAFLEVAAEDRNAALYQLALTAGMRQGELLGLRWKDVDLGRGIVTVGGSLQRTPQGLQILEPKTKRSWRRLMLAASARSALEAHRRQQAAERLRAANVWHDNDLVFCGLTGTPLDAGDLRKEFTALLRKAGLPRIRFHDLRHTAATLMMGSGVNPKIASEILGHSTVNITLDLYSHVSTDMQREAMAAVDGLLGG